MSLIMVGDLDVHHSPKRLKVLNHLNVLCRENVFALRHARKALDDHHWGQFRTGILPSIISMRNVALHPLLVLCHCLMHPATDCQAIKIQWGPNYQEERFRLESIYILPLGLYIFASESWEGKL
jgi:hypothetical protein